MRVEEKAEPFRGLAIQNLCKEKTSRFNTLHSNEVSAFKIACMYFFKSFHFVFLYYLAYAYVLLIEQW